MNSYDRYMGMISNQKVDIVPRIPILMHFAADHIKVSYADFARDYSVLVKANIELTNEYDIDQLDIMSDPYRETSAFGAELEYRTDTIPKCSKLPLAETKNLDLLSKPSITNSVRLQNAVQAIKEYKRVAWKKYSITGWVEGPAAEAADLRGVEQFLMDIYDDPAFCKNLMSLCVELAIDFAKAQIQAGADTVGIGDAIVSQVSPAIYENMIFPLEKRLVDEIHRSGGLVRLHICGDINRLLPIISTLGVDIIDCDHMIDMKLARKQFGQKCVLSGNLDPVSGVLEGNPDTIYEYYKKLYNEIGNPFFVNAGCEIPYGTPSDNLKALCKPIPAF